MSFELLNGPVLQYWGPSEQQLCKGHRDTGWYKATLCCVRYRIVRRRVQDTYLQLGEKDEA